jgi:mono/diheme cytochrome c family protein
MAAAGAVAAFPVQDVEIDGVHTPTQEVDQEKVLRGRQAVIDHGCGGCHGGLGNPDAEGWLAGAMSPDQAFLIGNCAPDPNDMGCFRTLARNLTPDNTTGMGRFSERQIFNSLRYGLRPGETADVDITGATPGEGNFPVNPKYLAPPMPWPSWRHIPDEDLWAIAAYLKHGVKPVSNRVADSQGPPDFWAGAYTAENIGTYPAPAFPTAMEVMPTDPNIDVDLVRTGRQLVLQHACGDCHTGGSNPNAEGWLAGGIAFPLGPCGDDTSTPCLVQHSRNLTPDVATGLGSASEQQIFNALRHGLRPSGSPDHEITAENFPSDPDYLGPVMPWYELRHMADEDLWAIASYLKHGVRPVTNAVTESDRAPEGWGSEYTDAKVGSYPAPPFPTSKENGG